MKGMYTKVVMMLLSFALLSAPAQAAFVTKAAVETSNVATTAMKSAVTSSWKSMSRAERKDVRKQLKETLRSKLFKGDASNNTVLLVILCFLLAPLAVYLHEGEINNKFWIDLALTILTLGIGGLIYGLYVVLSK